MPDEQQTLYPDAGTESAPQDVTEPASEPDVVEERAAEAAAQSPAEPQVVPETRPQTFTQPDPGAQSAASQRLAGAPAHGQDEIDAANSDENKEAAADASRTPNLVVGQRVTITGDHSEAGRMAYVVDVIYKDPIQHMIAKSGTSEARFAEVLQYVVATRDGRSDTLVCTPDQVQRLEVNEGWGRGQI